MHVKQQIFQLSKGQHSVLLEGTRQLINVVAEVFFQWLETKRIWMVWWSLVRSASGSLCHFLNPGLLAFHWLSQPSHRPFPILFPAFLFPIVLFLLLALLTLHTLYVLVVPSMLLALGLLTRERVIAGLKQSRQTRRSSQPFLRLLIFPTNHRFEIFHSPLLLQLTCCVLFQLTIPLVSELPSVEVFEVTARWSLPRMHWIVFRMHLVSARR